MEIRVSFLGGFKNVQRLWHSWLVSGVVGSRLWRVGIVLDVDNSKSEQASSDADKDKPLGRFDNIKDSVKCVKHGEGYFLCC